MSKGTHLGGKIREHLRPILETHFENLLYFYRRMRYRMFVILGLSLVVGILDGFGLAMFIPLLEFATDIDGSPNPESMGNLRFLVDGMMTLGLRPELTNVLMVLLFFFLFKAVIVFFTSSKQVRYSQYFIRALRVENIRALSEYRYEQFAQADVGRIQNTLSGEIGRISQAMNTYMLLIKTGMLILAYSVLALVSNPQFAMLVLLGSWASNLAFKAIYTKTKHLSSELTRVGHSYQRLLIQQATHFKYLKATGFIRSFAEKLIRDVEKIEEANRKMGILGSIVGSVREPLMILILVVMILVQVKVFGGSFALILLSILFFYRALTHVLAFQGQWNDYLGLTGSIKNLLTFSDHLHEHREPMGSFAYGGLKQDIQLHQVSFHYKPGRKVLTDVSLQIRKNETIALVGESGSGKTTLANLLAGLLRPTNGSMFVDGVDMRFLDVRQYQGRIGYITQEPVIFDDSIFNNVARWDEDTADNRDRVRHALDRAHLATFVQSLPENLDTRLGNNGINLSGGQRQRVAIARELYRDVDLLIMDEATSSLDSESESLIRSNIDEMRGSYTIVIIAHRLSTIRNVDRVVVMRHGRIESTGIYADLLNTSETFSQWVGLQAL